MKPYLRMGNPERLLPDHRSTVVWVGLGLLLALVVGEFFASTSATSADATLGAAAVGAIPVASTVPDDPWMRSYVTFDHSVVNQHSTAHGSDQPGASIAEYGP
jgi:hypothetical protein